LLSAVHSTQVPPLTTYSVSQNAGRHFKDEHPKLEAEHVARQAQPKDAQLNRGSSQAQAQDTIAGPSTSTEGHRMYDPGYEQPPSPSQWSPHDGINPRSLGPNSLSKPRPLTLRQQVRYRMLYTA